MARLLALIIASAAALALMASPADGRALKRGDLRLALPDPGHVSLLALKVVVRARRPVAFPRRVRVRVRRARLLPPDVRVLTATRLRRTRRQATITALVFTVRKAGSPPRARAAQQKQNIFDLMFDPEAEDTCTACLKDVPLEDLHSDGTCRWCRASIAVVRHLYRPSVDTAAAPNFDELKRFVLGGVLDESGAPGPGFSFDSFGSDAFDWSVRTEADTRKAVTDLIEDLFGERPEPAVPALELNIDADINGDGVIGPGAQVDTTVNPPVITGGDPQPTP